LCSASSKGQTMRNALSNALSASVTDLFEVIIAHCKLIIKPSWL